MFRNSTHIFPHSPTSLKINLSCCIHPFPLFMGPMYIYEHWIWMLRILMVVCVRVEFIAETVERSTRMELWESEDEREIMWRNYRCPFSPTEDWTHPSTDTCPHPLPRVIFAARYCVSCDVQAPLLIFMEHKLKQREMIRHSQRTHPLLIVVGKWSEEGGSKMLTVQFLWLPYTSVLIMILETERSPNVIRHDKQASSGDPH